MTFIAQNLMCVTGLPDSQPLSLLGRIFPRGTLCSELSGWVFAFAGSWVELCSPAVGTVHSLQNPVPVGQWANGQAAR